MLEKTFEALDRFADTGDRTGALDLLIEHFRANKEFHLFFEAKLMKKRLEMGLPLIQSQSSSEFSDDVRPGYEQAMIEAAREAGTLALDDGDIARAWPYFRAIGEHAPIAKAIEQAEPEDSAEQIINIAFREGVHPTKGLALILEKHGMCQAITAFGMYAVEKGRTECIGLLVRSLHAEVREQIARVVEAQEGEPPQAQTIADLIAGREWLFGEYDYYVDTSHLLSLLPYSLDVTDRGMLELFHDLCEYGKRLSPMFQSRGHAPFEQPFIDYDQYVLAMMGDDVDARIAHFRKKIAESDPEEVGTAPAQLLVNLAVRVERIEEALQVSLDHLADEESSHLTCPSALQLCNLAKDYDRLKELARNRGDLLSYVAATADSKRT